MSFRIGYSGFYVHDSPEVVKTIDSQAPYNKTVISGNAYYEV